jgi:hypothetical protein
MKVLNFLLAGSQEFCIGDLNHLTSNLKLIYFSYFLAIALSVLLPYKENSKNTNYFGLPTGFLFF